MEKLVVRAIFYPLLIVLVVISVKASMDFKVFNKFYSDDIEIVNHNVYKYTKGCGCSSKQDYYYVDKIEIKYYDGDELVNALVEYRSDRKKQVSMKNELVENHVLYWTKHFWLTLFVLAWIATGCMFIWLMNNDIDEGFCSSYTSSQHYWLASMKSKIIMNTLRFSGHDNLEYDGEFDKYLNAYIHDNRCYHRDGPLSFKEIRQIINKYKETKTVKNQ